MFLCLKCGLKATRFSQLVDNLAFALKPPTAQLMQMINGYQVTQALGAFATLHIAEAMERLNPAGLSDVRAIAAVAEVDPDALRRLLRMLAAVHLVTSDGGPAATRFGMTPATRLLLKDAPGSLWGGNHRCRRPLRWLEESGGAAEEGREHSRL